MKITIEIDCTPDEARRFLEKNAPPAVQPAQKPTCSAITAGWQPKPWRSKENICD
jgi:hypothetical protein